MLKNGFNVPGTPFEAMFALPVPNPDCDDLDIDNDNLAVEGSSLENPIHLPDVSATDFRAFLKILYPLYVARSLKNGFDIDSSDRLQYRSFRLSQL